MVGNKTFFFVVCVLMLSVSWNTSANSIKISITKENAESWYVTYTTALPVTRLSFVRTPNKSRTKRWSAFSKDYVLNYKNNNEFIQRVDGHPFTTVSFNLTPTYIPFAKEYAPFSPFSDGGMLFHSGRFFVCAEICRDGQYVWEMELIAPQTDSIIVRGSVEKGKARWIDAVNGQKIYVGDTTPIKTSHFVSIIDRQLPEKLHKNLTSELPQLMIFFSNKFGELGYRPSLFASYSKGRDGGYGNQGGTLPGQIFMHWYGKKSIQPFDTQSTYWFFAHEVAHLYQGDASLIDNPEEAWVHEGAAELFAGLASDPQYFELRIKKAKQQCSEGLDQAQTYSQAVIDNPVLHYSCGLAVMSVIDADLNNTDGKSIFELWMLFNKAVSNGATANSRTFINIIKPHLSPELGDALAEFVTTNQLDLTAL